MMDEFVGGPAMINFIKHGAVHISDCGGKSILLIKERGIAVCIDGFKDRTIRRLYDELIENSGIISGNNAKVTQIVIHIYLIPVKDRFHSGISVDDFPFSGYFIKSRD